jgi:hypothetical protein
LNIIGDRRVVCSYDPEAFYADRSLDFAEALEKLFNLRVDVLTNRLICNRFFRSEVERTARVIYEETH